MSTSTMTTFQPVAMVPPGPPSWTFVDRMRMTFMPPRPLVKALAMKYGDTFRISIPEETATFTGDPSVIRDIYTADSDAFDPRGVDVTAPIFGFTSLPVSTGARHKRDRKLLSPPFQSGAMKNYGSTMADITRSTFSALIPGQTFSLLEAAQSMALDVILRVVYGVEDEAEQQKTRATVLELIHSLSPFVLIFPWLRRDFGGLGPWARLVRAGKTLESLVVEQIRKKRASGHPGDDIMSLLVRVRDEDGDALTDVEIAEQLRAILFAGHETTAMSIAMLVDMLHRHPTHLERVLSEVHSLGPNGDAAELASLPFLGAACHEALRMFPPVVDVGRVIREPMTLGKYRFGRKEAIVPSPLLLHNREDLYPEPERFQPERFLSKKPSPFEFIVFGGGARRCLGAAFALFEMKVIVGTMLREYRFWPMAAKPVEQIRRGITLGPKGNVPMVFVGKPASA
ncbi:MAG: cytochrome P450 [Polyangiaceae bacterium]|nr:cytochrome P450 [Polyangiaceae bacterium]